MSDFVSCIIWDISWFSPPFYSHIGGYKICLRVDANGVEDGAGTYVSVSVYLMRGEYDDDLVWPFTSDISLKLMNHRADEEHLEHTFNYVAERPVSEGERAISGIRRAKFIPHSALSYSRNAGFLNKDSLKFKVVAVSLSRTIELPLQYTSEIANI